ncbi:DUF1127 domain-containing protein [Roseovarius sp. CH_XMU1461]|uniref:DUF1127 domain-containing protein n=1 Tax=Roseovarius sp. CH_XMU1461 TaxID=3107777 RepID=UPI003008642D
MTQLTSTRSRTQALHSRRGLLPRLQTWASLRRQRRLLAELDADRLADIGLTRTEALSEARRPFWDEG